MIVLDTTIVNAALPSIREDLGFAATSLAWVVPEAVGTAALDGELPVAGDPRPASPAHGRW